MNSIILNGELVADPEMSVTKSGARKAQFQLTTDGKDMPLYFRAVCFGVPANSATDIFAGDEALVAGRLTANVVTRGVTLVCHALELLHEAEPEPDLQPGPQPQ
jgi:single-stranded DNA-binding protein